MIKLMLAFFTLSLLFGCAGSPLQKTGTFSSIKELNYPSAGVVTTAGLGERLVASGKSETGLALRVSSPTTFGKSEGEASIMTCGVTVQPDIKFKRGERTDNGITSDCFGPFTAIISYSDGTTGFNCPGAVASGYVCRSASNTAFYFSNIAKQDLSQGFDNISVGNHTLDRADNFIQEFLYNGRSGNTLRFIYREFSNDIARPAFTQDVQYDLKDSNIIGFRDLRMRVVSATNTEIKYQLLNNF